MQLHISTQTEELSTFPPGALAPGFQASPPPVGGGVPVALDTPLQTFKHWVATTSLTDYRQAKAEKLLDCGGTGTYKVFCVSETGCQTYFDAPRHCGSRLCASCTLRSAKKLAARWRYKLQDTDTEKLALLTLTLRISTDYTLAARYELAYDAAKKLSRQQLFTRNVSGWVRKIEVKPAKRGGWNVHIHMIVQALHERRVYRAAPGKRRECDFYPADGSLKLSRQTISDAWRELTGDSHRVDLIPVSADAGGSNGAVKYLLKYMLKQEGFSAATIEGASKILDYQRTMKGRRTIQAGGRYHAAHRQYSLRRPLPRKTGCAKCGSKLLTEYGLRDILHELADVHTIATRYHDYDKLGDFNRLVLVHSLYGFAPDFGNFIPQAVKNILAMKNLDEAKDKTLQGFLADMKAEKRFIKAIDEIRLIV